MMARGRYFMAVLIVLLCVSLALPVAAAKPETASSGILAITTGGTDTQLYMAVCVTEEDGKYVYSGNHPIQDQTVVYYTVTNSVAYNSGYAVEEDSEDTAVQGIYRFKLGDKLSSGSEADVLPDLVPVTKNETVYFVHMDLNNSECFVAEKTTVTSVRNQVLKTEDKLEEEYGNGEFSVIFNNDGDVVGFCKAGIATAPLSSNSGSVATYLIPLGAFVIGCIIWRIRKKKQNESCKCIGEDSWPSDDETLLDDPIVNWSDQGGDALVLKCHGGYLNGRIYSIPKEGLTIGRERENTISYPPQTPGVSRYHVKLFWQNGQLMLLDVGSSNGTFVNQTGKIGPMHPVPLKPGDIFYIGEKKNAIEISCR